MSNGEVLQQFVNKESVLRPHYVNATYNLATVGDTTVKQAIRFLLDPDGEEVFSKTVILARSENEINPAFRDNPDIEWRPAEYTDDNGDVESVFEYPVLIYDGVEGARNYLRFVADGYPQLLTTTLIAFPSYSEMLRRNFRRMTRRLLKEGKKVDTDEIWKVTFQENEEAQKLEAVTQEIKSLLRRIADDAPQGDDLETLQALCMEVQRITHPEYRDC